MAERLTLTQAKTDLAELEANYKAERTALRAYIRVLESRLAKPAEPGKTEA